MTRLVAAGLTGALAVGLVAPVAASAAVPRAAAEEGTDGYVNICRYAPLITTELNRAQRWLEKVDALAPPEWDSYIEWAQQAIERAKQRIVDLVESGHCRVSIARLCNYADAAKRLFTRVNNLLTAGIQQSSGELRQLLEQGQAHLQRVARYVQRLANAHCDT